MYLGQFLAQSEGSKYLILLFQLSAIAEISNFTKAL